jgi:NADPH:quinone reductase-like Zn-dependent oxidoreductase
MPNALPHAALQLRSLIRAPGTLELSLHLTEIPPPGADEVTVRIEATPINPSDIGLLIGPADPATARAAGTPEAPVLTAEVPAAALPFITARLDQSMPVGNEGAGTVIATGDSPAAKALLGRTVAILGGAMYAQYRTLPAAACLVLPDDARPADGASCFVNPLTALSMVETMRREGHKALVHTAAASNLGQMLNRICLEDGVALVNVVRNQAQADILRGLGAKYIVDSSAPDFLAALTEAVHATGATLAFDAVGGGKLASDILTAMEIAANRNAATYSRYGSTVHKQVYIYGVLDNSPTVLHRAYGMAWSVSGWLLTPFLMKMGMEETKRLQARVAANLRTTFASHYSAEISLQEALDPEMLRAYTKRATGEKFLINPNKLAV